MGESPAMNRLLSKLLFIIRLVTLSYSIVIFTSLAKTFPTKPIRLVAANAAGGNADIVSRLHSNQGPMKLSLVPRSEVAL